MKYMETTTKPIKTTAALENSGITATASRQVPATLSSHASAASNLTDWRAKRHKKLGARKLICDLLLWIYKYQLLNAMYEIHITQKIY
jgi:hypothetical protein